MLILRKDVPNVSSTTQRWRQNSQSVLDCFKHQYLQPRDPTASPQCNHVRGTGTDCPRIRGTYLVLITCLTPSSCHEHTTICYCISTTTNNLKRETNTTSFVTQTALRPNLNRSILRLSLHATKLQRFQSPTSCRNAHPRLSEPPASDQLLLSRMDRHRHGRADLFAWNASAQDRGRRRSNPCTLGIGRYRRRHG